MKALKFYGVVLLLVCALLGCRMLAPAATDTPPTAIQPQPALATPTALAPTEVPPVEAGSVSIDYVYTDNLITSLYHLYGSVLDHFVDITVTNSGPEATTVIVQTQVDGYTTQASDTLTLEPGESQTFHQNPRLVPEAIDHLNAQMPGNFRIKATLTGQGAEQTILDETHPILIYSRRDFVWVPGLDWPEEYELWAAWVTPNDPSVEALIRAAANYDSTGIITSGYGDQALDGDGSVWRRMEALWQAEAQNYRLTYISTMTTFGPGSVQRMRLPAEVLEQSSGNCVELAALYASAAEAMGLEAAIVRIPGHAYTAVRMDLENAQYYFIETTLIGRASFAEAVKRGSEEWGEAQPHFDAQDEGYAWVTIPAARAKGILPIPWR